MYSCNYNFLKFDNYKWNVDFNELEKANYVDVSFDLEHITKDIIKMQHYVDINENNVNAQNHWNNYLDVAKKYKFILTQEVKRRTEQIPSHFLLRKLNLTANNIYLVK
jgi:uncharacterized membrane-anchored protein